MIRLKLGTRQGCLTLLLVLTVLSAPAVCGAQQPDNSEKNLRTNDTFNLLISSGLESINSLDYSDARRTFGELANKFPDQPAGPHYLAQTLWLEMLFQSRRLLGTVYSSESFYSKTEDKPDPQKLAQFQNLVSRAKNLAQVKLRRDPNDVEALYFLGSSEALKAVFTATVERRFMSALREGSRAVDHHRKVVKLDPEFHDAEVTIGLYDYVAGSLPLPVKLLAAIGGIRGSKKRGIETIQRVAEKGRWRQGEAKAILIALLQREERYAESVALARELSAESPRNYILKLEIANSLVAQSTLLKKANQPDEALKAQTEALAIFDALPRDPAVRSSASLDLVHYQYGEALMRLGLVERAVKEFTEATSAPSAEPSLVSMAHLRTAQALDLLNRRDEAIGHYNIVLKRQNVYDSHEQARKGLRSPYRQ